MISAHAFSQLSFQEYELKELDAVMQKTELSKNEVLCKPGHITNAIYFVWSGALYQYIEEEGEEKIIDMHLDGEWICVHHSLIKQVPSKYGVKAFHNSTVYSLHIQDAHTLIAKSPRYFLLGTLLEKGKERTDFYDHHLSPLEKYTYLQQQKPQIFQAFPLKMIASYLKTTPETLSRIRAGK